MAAGHPRAEGGSANPPSAGQLASSPEEAAKKAQHILSEFNMAFSLMSVIPLLICTYLITVKFFTISILEGLNGVYFLVAVLVALLGLLAGRIALRQIIDRLVKDNTKLEALNDQQAAFVSNVAHEFRAPLTVIKTAMDNLADGLHGSLTTDQIEPVLMCQRESNRLKRMVGDLLDIARLEAGKLRLLQEELVLQDLLSSTAELFQELCKKRGLQFTLHVPEAPAKVIGDRDRLQQVFINLLANAVKFTEKGGVEVRLTRNAETCCVEIIDTGPGIAGADLERIFDKFERVGATQGEEGSGLGLPIARDLISLHHGRLWVESQLGQGSRFIVTLPVESGRSP